MNVSFSLCYLFLLKVDVIFFFPVFLHRLLTLLIFLQLPSLSPLINGMCVSCCSAVKSIIIQSINQSTFLLFFLFCFLPLSTPPPYHHPHISFFFSKFSSSPAPSSYIFFSYYLIHFSLFPFLSSPQPLYPPKPLIHFTR